MSINAGRAKKGETLLTTGATFRLALQSLYILAPLLMMVITINPLDAQALSMTFALVLSNLVFLKRVDIWVIIEYGGAHTMSHQPLYDG